MKLIDILVGSGDGMSLFRLRTKYLAMDPDGRVYGYTEMPTPGIIGWSVPDNLYSTDGRGCLIQIDRDDVDGQWQSAIITREQYEAALAAKNDGWIDWPGGECPPVSTSTVVDVKFKNGNVQSGYPAGEYSWEHAWQGANIIAYRLHQPQEVAQAESEQEADLNDCIGQAPTTEWNGEGLPPAGCVCERSWAGDKWLQCKIIFTGDEIVLVKLATREAAYQLSDVRFRPIRSEAERKRSDIIDALTNFTLRGDATDIYDAIAAGKIPGIKLDG